MVEVLFEILYFLIAAVDFFSGIKGIKYLKTKRSRNKLLKELNQPVEGREWWIIFLILTPIIIVWTAIKFFVTL